MVPLNVRVNTFFEESKKPFIDNLTKFYIVALGIFGLNRLPVILKDTRYFYIVTSLTFAYSLILVLGTVWACHSLGMLETVVGAMSCTLYSFATTFSFISWKRIERYYNELNKFDCEIGCRPKITNDSIQNLVILVLFAVSCTVCFMTLTSILDIYPLAVCGMVHYLEIYYYGHLLSLLEPRLRLINYYVESVLSNGQLVEHPKVEEFPSFKAKNKKNSEVKKLMDLYHIAIKAYDFLIDAIKWQLLLIIITSFIITLKYCYDVSLVIMHSVLQDPLKDVVVNICKIASEMVPLFSPCLFGDRVHNEVKRLRELLASRLYENNLDKSGRSAGRALLALTEARDLSFSLLRMLKIDISLPFKFIGLLVTYLIILLQFEKVITPTALPPTT